MIYSEFFRKLPELESDLVDPGALPALGEPPPCLSLWLSKSPYVDSQPGETIIFEKPTIKRALSFRRRTGTAGKKWPWQIHFSIWFATPS
jgi:hypothetical protein